MKSRPGISTLLVATIVFPALQLDGQTTAPASNAIPAAQASVQYAPDRDYDLQHVALEMSVDYAKLSVHATVTNTLAALRDSLTIIVFHCGSKLDIEGAEIDGEKATFTRDGDTLRINARHPLTRAKPVRVLVHYSASGEQIEGFHWVRPTAAEANRVGFWTSGELNHNGGWLPTWDYPNDLATTEETITVSPDWYVFGNGALKSDVLDADRRTRTFHWQMTQPHATYLLSLGAGLFDIRHDVWRGVPLTYAAPKGKGGLIANTFDETPKLLSFYSDLLGVKYPWPKYAQFGAYDFDNAVQYVSATIFDERYLADTRRGIRTSSGVVAHELAHQWFGNLVTPKHWGELWLSEGFAMFFGQGLYSEHWRGKVEYEHVIEDFSQDYFLESRRYKRPLSTSVYLNPDAMFDTHSYRKGGAVLHTLRRYLGDKVFYQGINYYLSKYQYTPVDSHDFCAAMTDGTGINLEPFCDQWIFKPGHPVLEYEWTWDDANKEIVLTVGQTRDTKDGTPLYGLNVTICWISGGRVIRQKSRIDRAEQTIRIVVPNKPDAVLLDPDHDFLREMPHLHWTREELSHILEFAPNAADRELALRKMLEGTPSESAVQAAAKAVRADSDEFPVFRSLSPLVDLARIDLRPLFRELLTHPALGHRYYGILGLRKLPADRGDIQTLRNMVNEQQSFSVVRAAVQTLRDWDAPGNRDIFMKAIHVVPSEDVTRLIAYDALAQADAAEGNRPSGSDAQITVILQNLLSDIAAGRKDSPFMTEGLRRFAARPNIVQNVTSWLKDARSFSFVLRDDVAERRMERRGAAVERIWYYKLVSGQTTQYLTFYVTADGKVADIDVTAE